jgi:hypothetical protein
LWSRVKIKNEQSHLCVNKLGEMLWYKKNCFSYFNRCLASLKRQTHWKNIWNLFIQIDDKRFDCSWGVRVWRCETSCHDRFRPCLRNSSDSFDVVSTRLLQGYFREGRGRRSSKSFPSSVFGFKWIDQGGSSSDCC